MKHSIPVRKEEVMFVHNGEDTLIRIPSDWVETLGIDQSRLRAGGKLRIWSDVDCMVHLDSDDPGWYVPYNDYLEFHVEVSEVDVIELNGDLYAQISDYLIEELGLADRTSATLERYGNQTQMTFLLD